MWSSFYVACGATQVRYGIGLLADSMTLNLDHTFFMDLLTSFCNRFLALS